MLVLSWSISWLQTGHKIRRALAMMRRSNVLAALVSYLLWLKKDSSMCTHWSFSCLQWQQTGTWLTQYLFSNFILITCAHLIILTAIIKTGAPQTEPYQLTGTLIDPFITGLDPWTLHVKSHCSTVCRYWTLYASHAWFSSISRMDGGKHVRPETRWPLWS